MLKRINGLLGRQKLVPWVGEFKETLAQAMFWGTIVNGTMIAGTFYYTTLRHIAPWLKLPIFLAVAVVLMLVVLVIEFKFVVPSIWAFRGRQMDLRKGQPKSQEGGTVVVAGGFDPLNGEGHTSHIQEARKLGGRLVVILARDDQLKGKNNKPSGTFYPSVVDRMTIMRELKSVDEVVLNIDRDGTCAETLRMVKPQIFAKGGDRTPDNMPENELAVCREIGCRIVYNVGTSKKTSSSELVQRSAS